MILSLLWLNLTTTETVLLAQRNYVQIIENIDDSHSLHFAKKLLKIYELYVGLRCLITANTCLSTKYIYHDLIIYITLLAIEELSLDVSKIINSYITNEFRERYGWKL